MDYTYYRGFEGGDCPHRLCAELKMLDLSLR
jgi:hypothetical protein